MNGSIKVKAYAERYLLEEPFRISRHCFTHSQMMVVELSSDGFVGRGESEPHEYDEGELNKAVEYAQSLAPHFANGMTIAELNKLLPSGPIRNAFDCALWDLLAKKAGKRVWEIAGLATPKPLPTVFTLSIETPEYMAQKASRLKDWSRFKIKLGGIEADLDIERVRAIRAARPDAELIVDANGGWDLELLRKMTDKLSELDVMLIEQPLLFGADKELLGFKSPVPLCADETCLDCSSLEYVLGRYQYINIKLDKTGGLTEALALVNAAKDAGLGIMVGCMAATSLAMAPAHLIAQYARFVDLDGPMLLAKDRDFGMVYKDGMVYPPIAELWG